MQHIYRKQTSHVLAHRPVPLHTQVSLPDHLQVFQWNASRSLDSAIWIHWCDSSPYDLIIIQESGWSMINEWNNAHWHIVHTADRYILILFMVCSAVIKSRWPYTYRAECCRYAWLCLDSQAWSTQYGIRQILSKRQHVWHQLRQCLEYIPQRYLI